MLFLFLVSFVGEVIDAIFFDPGLDERGPVGGIVTLVFLLPLLAVSVRRLHDVDHSGWFILFGLIPLVGWIILLVPALRDSVGPNDFGPSPKYPTPPPALSDGPAAASIG